LIRIRRKDQRGLTELGWLKSHHTFSFADYHEPTMMGFRALRVLNEDRVRPGQGFPTHAHRDMEILSYVLDGAIEHRDSLGNGSVIRPGEIQRMTAGTGVSHSEYNASRTQWAHFIQIWIQPEEPDLPPGYEQKMFPATDLRNQLCLLASREGDDGSIRIYQDVAVYGALLDGGNSVVHRLAPGRHAWIQILRGDFELNRMPLSAGDGAAISEEASIEVLAKNDSEALLIDLA